jgi:hypothetical protein
MESLSKEQFDKLHKVLFTEPPSHTPRFSFDPETQSWRQHEEIKDRIPALANPNYVDADPVEMWIDFTTGEVKETSIRQTAPPTQPENC